MDGPFLGDTFAPLEDARAIASYLIQHESRFGIASQARIAYLLQQPMLTLKGEAADAYIAVASAQGAHRLLFPFLLASFHQPTLDPVDFVIYFDAAAWRRRAWNAETGDSGYPIEREALVYHELCHLRQLETADGDPKYHEDGREMLALRSHTYEFFQEEITKYGPRTLHLEQVAIDVVIGSHAEKVRERRGKLRRVK